MTPKDQGPPGGSRPPNGHKKVAPVERPELTTARNPEQTLSAAAQTDLKYLHFLQRPIALLRPGTRISYPPESDNVERWGAEFDPERVVRRRQQYPRADRGVALGGGLVVIDFDRKNGKDGFASLQELEIQLGPLPMTATVRTPHGGGQHRYFTVPNDVPLQPDFRSGVDILGDGSLAPLPNHFGWTGAEEIYEWENRKRIAALPPAWREAITRVRRSPSRRVRAEPTQPPAASPAKIDADLADKMAADGGRGNSTDPADYFLPDDVAFRIICALAVTPAGPVYKDRKLVADCSRETWWRVGAGIYDALGEEGFAIFDDWSSTAEGCTSNGEPIYTPEGTRRMWRECAKMRSITVATVYAIADGYDRSWREFYDNEMRARRAGR